MRARWADTRVSDRPDDWDNFEKAGSSSWETPRTVPDTKVSVTGRQFPPARAIGRGGTLSSFSLARARERERESDTFSRAIKLAGVSFIAAVEIA